MSQKVHLVARLNVIATNFGYFGLSYVMLMRLVEISSGKSSKSSSSFFFFYPFSLFKSSSLLEVLKIFLFFFFVFPHLMNVRFQKSDVWGYYYYYYYYHLLRNPTTTGDRAAFPAALETLKYSHRAHGFSLLAIAIISTLFHSFQMDVMRDAREAYCSCCARLRKRRSKNEKPKTPVTRTIPRAPRRSRSEPDFANASVGSGVEHAGVKSASVKAAVADRIQWASKKQSFDHHNTPEIVNGKTRVRESSPVSTLCLSTETCDPLVADRKFSALSPSPSSSTTTTPSTTEHSVPKSFREEDEMEDEEKIRNAIKNYRWGAVSNLICCDVVTAVSYCLFLMLSHGEKTVVTNGLLPLSVLWFGASSKAKGRYWNYAIWHAVWHVLSAALMAKVLIA